MKPETRISYKFLALDKIAVYLGRKRVGEIRCRYDTFQYFPKGQKLGGEMFWTLGECKRSLEQ